MMLLLVAFGVGGFFAHMVGLLVSLDHGPSLLWFTSGTVLWCGAFMILGFFYTKPVTGGAHRRYSE